MDQLPRLGKRKLCLLLFTCNCVVSVRRGFLFLWVLGMGYVILLWHSLSLPFLLGLFYLHLSISNGFVSSKLLDKRDDFDFDIVNLPFLYGDVPRRPSYGVYISQLIRFARVCSHVDDFNIRYQCLTAKLLKQGYRYH